MDSAAAIESLAALAQDTRLAIFRMLVETGATGLSVGEIGAPLQVAPATLTFHLKELANAGLVRSRQDGRYVFYSADYGRMQELIAFLSANCCARDNGCETSCGPARRSNEAIPGQSSLKESR